MVISLPFFYIRPEVTSVARLMTFFSSFHARVTCNPLERTFVFGFYPMELFFPPLFSIRNDKFLVDRLSAIRALTSGSDLWRRTTLDGKVLSREQFLSRQSPQSRSALSRSVLALSPLDCEFYDCVNGRERNLLECTIRRCRLIPFVSHSPNENRSNQLSYYVMNMEKNELAKGNRKIHNKRELIIFSLLHKSLMFSTIVARRKITPRHRQSTRELTIRHKSPRG
jgi:hypothetical protein